MSEAKHIAIDRDLIQKILQRLAALQEGCTGERFCDLADKETIHRHLLYMKGEGLIEAEEYRTGRMNQNLERVYAIRLTNAGYQALQPELKKAAANQATVKNNPWASGLFYLFAVIVVTVLLLIMVKVVTWIVLPLVIVASITIVALIGALQLRNDDRLSEKSFLELMGLTLKQLTLIRMPKKSGRDTEE